MRPFLVSIIFTVVSGSAMAQDATTAPPPAPAPNWGPVATATTADPQNGPNVGRPVLTGNCGTETLAGHTPTKKATKLMVPCAQATVALARIQSDERVRSQQIDANVTIAAVQILPALTDAQTRSSATMAAISTGRPFYAHGDEFAVGTDVALAAAVTSNGRGSSYGGGYGYGGSGSGVIADFRGDLYGRTPKTGTIPATGTPADKPDGTPVTPEEQAKIDAEALGQPDLATSVTGVQTAAAKIGATLATPTPAEKP